MFCSYLLCCYLFPLLLFRTILSHQCTLCQFNRSDEDSRSEIRIPPAGGVLICQFYLLLLRYHHKLSLHLLKMGYKLISHCVIHCRLEKNFYGWFSSTTLSLDDHHRVIGPCHLKLNRCNCVFCNLIDAF